MTIKNALASVAVKDLRAAASWYENLFGRAPDYIPMPEVVEWKFAGGGWLQVYQSKQHVGTTSITLSVDDIHDQITALKKLGVDVDDPVITQKVKLVMIKDPDGNSIAFAEALHPDMAQ